MVSVSSTAVEDVEYRERDSTMIVTMRDGERIQYSGVSKDVYEAFIHADSVGSYYNHNIRKNYSWRYL